MRQIQVIELHGRPVALAVGDKTITADHHITDDRAIVAGMALYALDIQAAQGPAGIPTPSATRSRLAQRSARRPRTRGAHPRPATRS
jgi:hypothetical protein